MKSLVLGLFLIGSVSSSASMPEKGLANTVEQGLLLTSVIANNEAYRLVPRSFSTYESLVDLKFNYQFWRQDTLKSVLKNESYFEDVPATKFSLKIIRSLNIKLKGSQLAFLKSKVDIFNNESLRVEFQKLLADFGEARFLRANYPQASAELSKLAGPVSSLKMEPIKPSKEKYKKWSKNSDFSNYKYLDGGVVYRGIHFLPGDILVNSLNHDSDGLFTVFADPFGFYAHSAFFAMLKKGDRVIPSVVESFERGVRAIPLNVFLSRKLTSYVEVVRPIFVKEEDFNKINEEARKLMDYVYGYNFYTADDSDRYVTCTRVGEELFRKSGLPVIKPNSYFSHPIIKKNLESLGLFDDYLLAPMDYITDVNTVFVGVVDNNMFAEQLTRDLVGREIRKKMEVDQFNFKKFPFRYKFNNWAIGVIDNGGPLAPIFRAVEGFNKKNFPKGPRRLKAFIEPLEAIMGKVVKETQGPIGQVVFNNGFESYEASLQDEKLIQIIDKNSKKIKKIFK